MNVDLYVFKLINSLAEKDPFLDQFSILLTDFSPIIIALVFGWIWFFKKGDKWENRKLIIFAGIVFVLAVGINYFINALYFRPRPFVDGAFTLLIDKAADSPSFPSNHATGAFAAAFAIISKDRKLGWGLMILAALIGISRIFVGVHYPTDILAGAAIAFIAFFIVQTIMNFIKPRDQRRKRSRGY